MQSSGDGRFPTTHWTLVVRLNSTDEETARRALEDICKQYHYPLYCYLRRRGLNHHDAQDVLHDFLAKLLRLDALGSADASKGRLRAFLSAALARFLINWRQGAQQRHLELSTDISAYVEDSEERFNRERFTEHDTPDRVFDRKWAQELLKNVLKTISAAYGRRGKSVIIEALGPIILRGGSLRGQDPSSLAAKLGMNEPALRKALQRAMAEYRKALENEVLQTVANPNDVPGELAYLRGLFDKR
jgi:RNA polymerase sigma-70 factor (ECF subfamily)